MFAQVVAALIVTAELTLNLIGVAKFKCTTSVLFAELKDRYVVNTCTSEASSSTIESNVDTEACVFTNDKLVI